MKNVTFKLLVVLLILSMSMGLAACGAKQEASVSSVIEDAVSAYYDNMPDHIYKIGQEDFVKMVKDGKDMFIMDIRQPDVYGEGHVKGAVNIPWGIAISENLDKLPMDKPIMVYCYTGQTAGQTVALLNMAGFNARSVNLGWNRGISKVEGVADITVSEASTLEDGASADINSEIKAAIDDYFQGLADVKGTTYANYKISEDDAKKLLDTKDKDVMFLSIRKAEDFEKGHIEGAKNIPFAKGMQKSFRDLPKGKKIIVYCYSGQTAGQTVAALRLLGYDAVSLNSGMGVPPTGDSGWVNKGYPVVQ